MTTIQKLLYLLPVAYLLGSVPFGLLVAKRYGVDPRKAGSGNIGATNVGRLLGKKVGITVFVFDLLKGLVPTLAASWVGLIDSEKLQRELDDARGDDRPPLKL